MNFKAPSPLLSMASDVNWGSSTNDIMTPNKINRPANIKYGIFVDSAEIAPLTAKKVNMRYPPKTGAMVVPNELKALVRFKRLDALSSGPNRDT
jgi:hypothetical protein